jgi:hypothetical protein
MLLCASLHKQCSVPQFALMGDESIPPPAPSLKYEALNRRALRDAPSVGRERIWRNDPELAMLRAVERCSPRLNVDAPLEVGRLIPPSPQQTRRNLGNHIRPLS